MDGKTTAEVALLFGVTSRTVERWCAELKVRKAGRDFILGDEDIAKLPAIRRSRGRPRTKK